MDEVEMRGLVDGDQMFGSCGPREFVEGMMGLYAVQFSSEGAVEVQEKTGRKWKTVFTVEKGT